MDAKRALLRARGAQQGEAAARLRVALRPTAHQRQQKAAAREQFEQLRNQSTDVTFYCGWRQQRRDGDR